MAVYFTLKQNNIRSRKSCGKFYAHTVRIKEVTGEELEEIIQRNCSARKSDVRQVLTELVEVMKDMLQRGYVVSLKEFGRFSLSVMSTGADSEDHFSPHNIKGLRCNFTPAGRRRGNGDHSIQRDFFEGCEIKEWKEND